jgi:hypothetical protein
VTATENERIREVDVVGRDEIQRDEIGERARALQRVRAKESDRQRQELESESESESETHAHTMVAE